MNLIENYLKTILNINEANFLNGEVREKNINIVLDIINNSGIEYNVHECIVYMHLDKKELFKYLIFVKNNNTRGIKLMILKYLEKNKVNESDLILMPRINLVRNKFNDNLKLEEIFIMLSNLNAYRKIKKKD